MTRYRTRPREVEAVQWIKPGDHPNVEQSVNPRKGLFSGIQAVYPTDWIVTDATGHRIVKADDFAEQFEEIGYAPTSDR